MVLLFVILSNLLNYVANNIYRLLFNKDETGYLGDMREHGEHMLNELKKAYKKICDYEEEIITKEYKVVATIKKLDEQGLEAQIIRNKISSATVFLSDSDCLALKSFANNNDMGVFEALSAVIQKVSIVKKQMMKDKETL